MSTLVDRCTRFAAACAALLVIGACGGGGGSESVGPTSDDTSGNTVPSGLPVGAETNGVTDDDVSLDSTPANAPTGEDFFLFVCGPATQRPYRIGYAFFNPTDGALYRFLPEGIDEFRFTYTITSASSLQLDYWSSGQHTGQENISVISLDSTLTGNSSLHGALYCPGTMFSSAVTANANGGSGSATAGCPSGRATEPLPLQSRLEMRRDDGLLLYLQRGIVDRRFTVRVWDGAGNLGGEYYLPVVVQGLNVGFEPVTRPDLGLDGQFEMTTEERAVVRYCVGEWTARRVTG